MLEGGTQSNRGSLVKGCQILKVLHSIHNFFGNLALNHGILQKVDMVGHALLDFAGATTKTSSEVGDVGPLLGTFLPSTQSFLGNGP